MIKSFRELKKFLLAYLIYNEGIETIIIMASIFSADVLKMKSDEIILFFLMIQGIAIFGSLIFGLLADIIGSKSTILISLIIWSFIVLWAFSLGIIWNQKTEYVEVLKTGLSSTPRSSIATLLLGTHAFITLLKTAFSSSPGVGR